MNFKMPEEPKVLEAFTLIAQGYSVAKACRECRVSKTTFYSKLAGSEELRDMYLQAQSIQAKNKVLRRAKQRAGLLE